MKNKILIILALSLLSINLILASPPAPSPVCHIEGTIKGVEFKAAYNEPCVAEGNCPTDTELNHPDRYFLNITINKVSYVSGDQNYAKCENIYPINSTQKISIKKINLMGRKIFEKNDNLSGSISSDINELNDDYILNEGPVACTMDYNPVCCNVNGKKQTEGNRCTCEKGKKGTVTKEGECEIVVGNDSDEHGCKASAGYSWCQTKGKCIRSWEENCSSIKTCDESNQSTCDKSCIKDSDCSYQNCFCYNKDLTITNIYDLPLQPCEYKSLDCECKNNICTTKNKTKILPETASQRAREVLGELGFNITLKEVGQNKTIYEAKATKEGKILGFIPAKAEVSAEIDAETGVVIKTHKPWWSFLAGI